MQFAFRWMNCLLMREISVQNTIRMWDTYLVIDLTIGDAYKPVSRRMLYAGRGCGCLLPVPSIRLLGVPRQVEQEAARDGLPGNVAQVYRIPLPTLFLTITMFQGIIMFLQSLPTQGWGDHEIEMLLSEAFVHYSTWHNAQSHFGKNK